MPGALDLLKFEPGGEYYNTFHQLQKIKGTNHKNMQQSDGLDATFGPLVPVPAQCTCSPRHGQRGVHSVLLNLS
jgi:hypothetical protein